MISLLKTYLKNHNYLIKKKEKLEIYRMLLLKTLETYEEKEVKKCK